MTDIKSRHSERKERPVPQAIEPYLKRYGLWIYSFYSNIASIAREMFPRSFPFYVITHMFDGSGQYWEPALEDSIKLSPGHCIIVSPGHTHYYGGLDGDFVEDSIAFTGPIADSLFKAGVITNGVVELGKNRRLLPIIEKVQNPSLDSQLEACVKLQALLFEIYHAKRHAAPRQEYPRIKLLIDEIQNTPERWWTVKEMAEYANISENHLRRLFSKITGMSPKNYIDNLKIQQAVERLCNSDLPIHEIADTAGYRNPYHFNRRFKEITGYPPATYRRKFSPLFYRPSQPA